MFHDWRRVLSFSGILGGFDWGPGGSTVKGSCVEVPNPPDIKERNPAVTRRELCHTSHPGSPCHGPPGAAQLSLMRKRQSSRWKERLLQHEKGVWIWAPRQAGRGLAIPSPKTEGTSVTSLPHTFLPLPPPPGRIRACSLPTGCPVGVKG